MNRIAEILASKTHVFFTPESANNFRQANYTAALPIGTVKFQREMSMDFFTRKCGEADTFSALPTDAEIMRRIMRDIPNFGADESELNAREKWEQKMTRIRANRIK